MKIGKRGWAIYALLAVSLSCQGGARRNGTTSTGDGGDGGAGPGGGSGGSGAAAGTGGPSGGTGGGTGGSGATGGDSGGGSGTPDGGPTMATNIPPPASHRQVFNFNAGWRFIRQDVTGAETPGFDDSKWTAVALPHTYNDVDTYTHFAGGNGETQMWTGKTWYRKHFTVPMDQADRKVFVEFQGVRQRAHVYLNGAQLGMNETGFVPFGFDLTPQIKFGQDNVLAVMCDSTFPMDAQAGGRITWHDPHWHPIYGGITRDVVLHVTDKMHVTLPLYSNLQTSGLYVHADNVSAASADVTAEIQLKNEGQATSSVAIEVHVLDGTGADVLTLMDNAMVNAGQMVTVTKKGTVTKPHLWEPASPYLYTVQTVLKSNGQALDGTNTPLGIRWFKFDKGSGFSINGHHLKLHGWGQKPTNSWAGLGAGVPDWLHEFTMRLEKDAGSNFKRWGHCAGPASAIAMSDKYGIITLQPGVDAESDTAGGAWTVRSNAFRDVLIYFRNNPSIMIWEAGNQGALTSAAHIAELRKLYDTWDPAGQRAFAFRRTSPGKDTGIMLNIGTQGENDDGSLPVVEGEYNRMEVARRVWDKSTPPSFGWKPGNGSDLSYAQDQEQGAVYQVSSWAWLKSPSHCGGANWHFTDEPTHRRILSEVARDSGEVDAVRLPKEGYWVVKSMWNDAPNVHLIGHWNYPANTTKTVYVTGACDSVELQLNGQSIGKDASPTNSYLFQFDGVKWQAGTLTALCTQGGKMVAKDERKTAGDAVALRLTPIAAPGGWRADGADILMLDVEAVDKDGNRVPTDQARVDFDVMGPAIWRGGYNSGKEGSTNNQYLDTEGGVNRVFLRSTATAGMVTVTAKRQGLMSGTVQVSSVAFPVDNGLSPVLPAAYAVAVPPPPGMTTQPGTPDAGVTDDVGPHVISAEFRAIYDTILKPRCSTACHIRATGATGDLAMPDAQTAYNNLVGVPGSANCMMRTRVYPRDADQSLLVNKVQDPMAPCGAHMPKGCKPGDPTTPCLTDAEVQQIRTWIENGAD